MAKFLTKRNLIIIGSVILAMLITLLILLFTVFALKYEKVTIEAHNSYQLFENEEFKNDVLESWNVKNKTSVFFINKQKTIKTLEKEFPQIKFINLETTFPSGIKVHVAKREAVFAIKNTNLNFYTIVDADFKVLYTLNSAEFLSLENKPIKVEFENSALINLEAGNFITQTKASTVLTDLSKYLLINNRDVEMQKSLFDSIVVYDNLLTLTLKDGFMIKIHTPAENLSQKTDFMLKSMSLIYPTYYQNHFMEVYMTQTGKLVVKFSIKSV